MATTGKVPVLGFHATAIKFVVWLGFTAGAFVGPPPTADVCLQWAADDVVVAWPADDALVQWPADDRTVRP